MQGNTRVHTVIHATADSVMGLLCHPHNFLLTVNCYHIQFQTIKWYCIHDQLVPKISSRIKCSSSTYSIVFYSLLPTSVCRPGCLCHSIHSPVCTFALTASVLSYPKLPPPPKKKRELALNFHIAIFLFQVLYSKIPVLPAQMNAF